MIDSFHLSSINTKRVDLFGKYADPGYDTKCIARALNRIGTDRHWEKLSKTLGFLALNLCARLNCDLNDEARFILIATLKGFYEGNEQSFKEIKIIS
jgi:hypothetical protein